MDRQQSNNLLEIVAQLEIGDNTVDRALATAMRTFYSSLLNANDGKSLPFIRDEFDKKAELLQWKLKSAFRKCHNEHIQKKEAERIVRVNPNEKEYTTVEVAEMLKMTVQNLNKHLAKQKAVKVRVESPRKRYISESELEKLKKLLGITTSKY
jgi:hypothetical protein